jgi:hypothetical protein
VQRQPSGFAPPTSAAAQKQNRSRSLSAIFRLLWMRQMSTIDMVRMWHH